MEEGGGWVKSGGRDGVEEEEGGKGEYRGRGGWRKGVGG